MDDYHYFFIRLEFESRTHNPSRIGLTKMIENIILWIKNFVEIMFQGEKMLYFTDMSTFPIF